MTTVRTTPSVSAPRNVRLSNISRLLLNIPPSKHVCEKTGNCKKDAIHNAESERSFQHSTVFVDIDFQTIDTTPNTTKNAEGNTAGECVITDMTAVGRGDTTEFVHTGYEGADEAEVDEGYKVGIGTRAVIGEEGSNSPDSGEDGDNE